MKTVDKKLQDLLVHGTDMEVMKAIDLSVTADEAVLLPFILERWRSTQNASIKTALFHLMINFRDDKVVPVYFKFLDEPDFTDLRGELVEILWQSGLDVSKYLDELISLALMGEYTTTVEVSTVIENLDHTYEASQLRDAVQRIEETIEGCDDIDMNNLLENLIDLINELPIV